MKFYIAGHALITKDGKFLVTHRSPSNDYMPLKWDIPGGEVLPGETMEDAIYREVTEETTLTIRVGPVVYVYTNRDQLPKRQTFQVIFLSTYLSGEVHLNPLEHDMYRWVNYDDIGNLDTIAFLHDITRAYAPPK